MSQEPISTTASHDPSHLQTRPWAPSCRTGEEGDRNNPWEVMPRALPWGTNSGYQRRKASASSSLRTRVRTWSRVGTSRRPAHLLLLDHALAHDLVARRLHEGVGDRLARAVALPEVRDPVGVGPRCSGRIRPASSPACAGLNRRRRHRGPSRGPRLPAGHGRRCRARENHVSRPSCWAARAPIPASMPLTICPITVRHIVMWNQSIRCSARGLR